jgi:hypothetical protein
MTRIVSNEQNRFNKINLTKNDEVSVGIDVHKKSCEVAVWPNNAPAIDFVTRNLGTPYNGIKLSD